MKKQLSGWQKVGIFAGIGCFSIVGVIVLALVVAVVYARSTLAQLGDPTPKHVEKTIALSPPPAALASKPPAATAPGSKPASSAASGSANDRLRLDIDLAEGSFTVRPGEAGSQVRVEGDYAEGLYELTERTSTDEKGASHTTIRFRGKAPAWARFFGSIGRDGPENRPNVTVTIPTGVPLDLGLRVSMGESRINLGGLTMGDLGLDLTMGNHEVDFRDPVVGSVNRLRLDARMGNISVSNLGNAHAKAIESTGSMGNLTADLGGSWQPGSEAEASFTHSMGELTVNVPSTVNLESSVSGPQGSENKSSAAEPSNPKAPVLRVRVSTSMGEGRVRRY